MKNFVRGGIIFTIVSVFVAIIFAQTRSQETLGSAKDSQANIENHVITSGYINAELGDLNIHQQEQDKGNARYTSDTKVTKTVSSRSTAGTSRGTFTATAYCLKGRTAMGHGVRRGIIAADPRVLKLGSQINLGAGSYSGQYLVSDTGGGVKGKRIDIWMPSCSEARKFGRRTVTISVL